MEYRKKKQHNQLFKFSNLAIQMGLIIGAGAYFGVRLDDYFKFEHLFTIILSLMSLFGSFIYVIHEVKKL